MRQDSGLMYRPAHFAEDDVHVLAGLARVAGFGHLVVPGDEGPESTPIPFVISDDGSLIAAHLARPNPLWKRAPCPGLLIVAVSDAYISPAWYASKARDGKVVPTWNYEVVHAHGRLVAHDDPGWIARHVRELTDRNEADRIAPWSVDDAPEDYIVRTAQAIVGVELLVDRLVGKRKLSQNRSDEDRSGAVMGLEGTVDRGAKAVAAAMRALDG